MKWIEMVGTPAVGKSYISKKIKNKEFENIVVYRFKKEAENTINENLLHFQNECIKIINKSNGIQKSKKTRKRLLIERLKTAIYLLNKNDNRITIIDEFLLQNGLCIAAMVEFPKSFLKWYIKNIPTPHCVMFIENDNINKIKSRLNKRKEDKYRYDELIKHYDIIPIMKKLLSKNNIQYITINSVDEAISFVKEISIG